MTAARRTLAVISVLAELFAAWLIIRPAPASAAVLSPGNRILTLAETRAGDWYVYGAAGPYTFDCSGIIYWAATALGYRNFPRDTYEMLSSPVLYRIPLQDARRGDLLFYGSGHVEIDTIWYHTSFGAREPGTRVGWHQWSGWWAPTMAYRVR